MLKQLCDMGFEYERSLHALERCNQDMGKAIDLLTQTSSLSTSATEFTPPSYTSHQHQQQQNAQVTSGMLIPLHTSSTFHSSSSGSTPNSYATAISNTRQPSSSSTATSTTANQRTNNISNSNSLSFSPVYRGRVISIHLSRGFGFITPSQPIPNYGNESVFFHFSKVADNQYLQINDEVVFTVSQNERTLKLYASDVRVMKLMDESIRGKKWPTRDSATTSHLIPSTAGTSQSTTAMSISKHEEYSRYVPPDAFRYGQILGIDDGGNIGRIVVSPTSLPFLDEGAQPNTPVVILLFDNRFVTPVLPIHTFVSFTVERDPTVGMIAANLRPIPSSAIFAATLEQSQLRNVCNNKDAILIHNETILSDETRLTEFKSLARSSAPESTFLPLVDKYATAFRNARGEGGWLYAGIEDDGRITGLRINRGTRDILRRGVDSVMQALTPSVGPEWYRLHLFPVHECLCDPNHPSSSMIDSSNFMSSSTIFMTVPDFFVVALQVLPPPYNAPIQMTSGRYTHNNVSGKQAYIRRDGSVRLMEAEMILSRERELQGSNQQKVVDEVLARLKADPSTHSPTRQAIQVNDDPGSRNVVLHPKDDTDSFLNQELELAENVIAMGYRREQVLSILFQLQQDRKRSSGVKKPIDYNQLLDRLNNGNGQTSGQPIESRSITSSSNFSNGPHHNAIGHGNEHHFQFSRDSILAPLQHQNPNTNTNNFGHAGYATHPPAQIYPRIDSGMMIDGVPCQYCNQLIEPSHLLLHYQICSSR